MRESSIPHRPQTLPISTLIDDGTVANVSTVPSGTEVQTGSDKEADLQDVEMACRWVSSVETGA